MFQDLLPLSVTSFLLEGSPPRPRSDSTPTLYREGERSVFTDGSSVAETWTEKGRHFILLARGGASRHLPDQVYVTPREGVGLRQKSKREVVTGGKRVDMVPSDVVDQWLQWKIDIPINRSGPTGRQWLCHKVRLCH